MATKIPTRMIGIPLDDVAPRLEELNKALEEHDMAIGAETTCNLEISHGGRIAKSATITVYFFQKHEVNNPFENLGNSKAVKNPEE